MHYATLITLVEQLAEVDRAQAERATQATLRTLSERISGGEARDIATSLPPKMRISAGGVRDLEDGLPANLHHALDRGLAESREARRMSEQAFIARVAEQEGIDLVEAESHAHAVFHALREVLSPKEYSDVTGQLSDDYAPLLV